MNRMTPDFYNPGDFFLEDGSGFVSGAIKVGERIYQNDAFCWASHAGMIVSSTGDTVEAEARGVRTNSLSAHIAAGMRFQVVNSGLDPRGRELAVAQAKSFIGTPYGYFTDLSIAIDMLDPDFIWRFRSPRTLICSELVARCLYHGGWDCPKIDFGTVKPSDLARAFQVPEPRKDT